MSDTIGAAQLKAFVERVERIEEEIATLNADKSDIYKEARSCGFDVKVLRKVVAKRKMDTDVRDEQDAIFEMYWNSIHGLVQVHTPAREKIEEFDKETGEIFAAARSDAGLNIVHKHTEIATAAQGEAGAPSDERVSPQAPATTGSDDANAGGRHEVAGEDSHTTIAGERTPTPPASIPAFLTRPAKPLRPYCQKPGREDCGGYGSRHCGTCEALAKESEAA